MRLLSLALGCLWGTGARPGLQGVTPGAVLPSLRPGGLQPWSLGGALLSRAAYHAAAREIHRTQLHCSDTHQQTAVVALVCPGCVICVVSGLPQVGTAPGGKQSTKGMPRALRL